MSSVFTELACGGLELGFVPFLNLIGFSNISILFKSNAVIAMGRTDQDVAMMFSDNKVAPLSAATRFHVAVLASQVIALVVFELKSPSFRFNRERGVVTIATVGVNVSVRLDCNILLGNLVFEPVLLSHLEATTVCGTVAVRSSSVIMTWSFAAAWAEVEGAKLVLQR